MRLWSIHPHYLDAKGLVALWREGLLAQKVLLGRTKGYKHHPQLIRFQNTTEPAGAVATYLTIIANEAERRGYQFDRTKISIQQFNGTLPVTNGQLNYEFDHLLRKLETRDPGLHATLRNINSIEPHPMFREIKGNREEWEKTS
ncbi:MAG TPA: pyrimidine dimer DNA glycosylase/endonuclease V [Pseudomonadota bacterium]|jgi:hypothetical protein|nr:pyrimidine dimer DNA glycosylase/endonuclease V [Pseudomonadota bacterium]